MKYRYSLSVILISLCLALTTAHAQINLSGSLTPQQLVQSLVGPGVTVSNVTFTGAPDATAFFTEPTASFGMISGILLTTGIDTIVKGPNTLSSAGVDNLMPGDSLLNANIDSTLTTFDACVLEFDFVPRTDSIVFHYVFGSEEYNEFVWMGYNDIFGFFISGPGINGVKNIALVPGTNTPVSIDSINNGYAPTGTLPTGPCTNCQYYVDNTNGTILQYDGYTTLLSAGTHVQPCGTYHIKLAIADVGDGVYDSGIFLEAGSFKSSAAFNIQYNGYPAPSVINVCPGECVTLEAPPLANYLWSNGDTTQSTYICDPGFYSVSTTVSTCTATSGNINVTTLSGPLIDPLTESNDTVYANVTGINPITYQWYSAGNPVGNGGPALAMPYPGCFYVTATDFNGCTSTSDSLCDFSVSIPEPANNIFMNATMLPGNHVVRITMNHEIQDARVELYDLTGKAVMTASWTGGTASQDFSLPFLSKGLYFLKVQSGENLLSSKVIVR